MTTFAEKITQWKTAIEAKIGAMIVEHNNDSSAHSEALAEKSKVSFTRVLNSGTRIGTITIDGTSTDVFCETDTDTTYNTATASMNGLMSSSDKQKLNAISDSADAVTFSQNLSNGTKIGTITINNTPTDLFCEEANGITYISVDDDLNLYVGYDPIVSSSLTSNKNIIQNGQNSTLSATIKTNNNVLLEGVPVDFYDGSNLLGSSVSNSSGIATYNYIGTGSGKKNITAKAGSVVSQPYPVIDGVFLDLAVTGKKETVRWRNNNNNLSVSDPSDDGTSLSQIDTSSTGGYYASTSTTDAYWGNCTNWTPHICVEFDLVSRTNGATATIFGDTTDLYTVYEDGSHVKIKYDGSNIYYYKDNNTTPVKTTSTSASTGEIQLRLVNGGTLKYKNFVIYPI